MYTLKGLRSTQHLSTYTENYNNIDLWVTTELLSYREIGHMYVYNTSTSWLRFLCSMAKSYKLVHP